MSNKRTFGSQFPLGPASQNPFQTLLITCGCMLVSGRYSRQTLGMRAIATPAVLHYRKSTFGTPFHGRSGDTTLGILESCGSACL